MENLFDLFGIDPDEVKAETEKKEEKAKTKAKAKKPAKKSSRKKKEETYALPIRVVNGYRDAFDITSDTEEEMSFAALKEEISKRLNIPKDILAAEISSDKKTVYAGVSRKKEIVKGQLSVTDETKFVLPDGDTFTLSTEKEEMSFDELREALMKDYGKAFLHGLSVVKTDDNTYYVCFAGEDLNKTLVFPIMATCYGKETIMISQDHYEAFAKAHDFSVNFSKETLIAYLEEKFPDIAGHIFLQHRDEDEKEGTEGTERNYVNVGVEIVETSTTTQKKETFPTNAKLMVISRDTIQLSPEDFGGKLEVTEDEIIAYAHDNVSPIFKKERCSVTYYDDDNFIYLTLKGSKKGAVKVVLSQQDFDCEVAKPYTVFKHIKGEREEYVEKNPGAMCICTDPSTKKGKFIPLHSKIPCEFFEALTGFFSYVSEHCHTEVMARIFYDIAEERYILDVPKQIVSMAAVEETDSDYDFKHNHILVGEFHSHNCYSAYFSPTDDADEGMAIAYGVFGPFHDPIRHLAFVARSFAAGQEVILKKEDIFTSEPPQDFLTAKLVSHLMHMFEENVEM